MGKKSRDLITLMSTKIAESILWRKINSISHPQEQSKYETTLKGITYRFVLTKQHIESLDLHTAML